MREKVVLIGAGSASFTRGLVVDILQRGWEGELALVDTDPDALGVAERLARKMVAAMGSSLRVAASTDRRAALPGATAVICTIGVGGRRAWEADVYVPQRHGVFQSVGDTAMPGGTSRALRMIPAMVAIAEDVLDLAPDALFFNYGNPMSAVCRGVRKATGAEMVGLCHGVFHVEHFLADTLGVARESLRSTAAGLNHLTWFTELRADGVDLMPRLRALAAERVAAIPRQWEAGGDGPTGDENLFSWQLTELFGAFPAVLDRHVVEFFPQFFAREGGYYGKSLGRDVFDFAGVIREGDRIFDEMRAAAEGPGPLPEGYFQRIGGEHEQVTEIIESIRTDAARIYSANLPNRGQIPNLPDDAILESPAAATGAGLRPIGLQPLSAGIAGTLAARVQWVETVVEAALERSRAEFAQALVLDGSAPSLDVAKALADDLAEAQAAHVTLT